MAIDLKRRTAGRPTVLTDEVWDSLVETVSKGNYVSVACRAAGICDNTYRNWLSAAKDFEQYIDDNNINIESISNITVDEAESIIPDDLKDKYVYWRLFQDLKTAQAKSIVHRHNLVVAAGEAGPQFWMAPMTSLERTNPEMYGKRDAIDINVKEGQEFLKEITSILKPKQLPAAGGNP
jgi:hypothetical protein